MNSPEVQTLYDQARELESRSRALAVDASNLRIQAYKLATGFEVGTRVKARDVVYEITQFGCRYDQPAPWGRKVLKSGELGKQEFEISIYSSIRKVE